MTLFNKTISIVGGTGHVGLPLGLALSEKNFNVQVVIQDLSKIFYPKINHIKTKNFMKLFLSFYDIIYKCI